MALGRADERRGTLALLEMILWEYIVCSLPLHLRRIGVSRQETNLNGVGLARDWGHYPRRAPLHSNLHPLRIPPHIPGDKLDLLDPGILPAIPFPRLGCVLHLHSHVADIPVHNHQLTNVAL